MLILCLIALSLAISSEICQECLHDHEAICDEIDGGGVITNSCCMADSDKCVANCKEGNEKPFDETGCADANPDVCQGDELELIDGATKLEKSLIFESGEKICVYKFDSEDYMEEEDRKLFFKFKTQTGTASD
jgi:hypothetical protein